MKKKIKFKIVYGFDPMDYYSIDSSELLKAYYAFLNNTKLILESGEALDNKGGLQIKRIEPDFNSYAGYVKGYKMRPRDYDDIPYSIQKKAKLIGSRTRVIVSDIIKMKDPEEKKLLLSTPLPELHKRYFAGEINRPEEVKKLAEKIKM